MAVPRAFLHHDGVDHDVAITALPGYSPTTPTPTLEITGSGSERTATITLDLDVPFHQPRVFALTITSTRGAGFETDDFTGTASAPGFATVTLTRSR